MWIYPFDKLRVIVLPVQPDLLVRSELVEDHSSTVRLANHNARYQAGVAVLVQCLTLVQWGALSQGAITLEEVQGRGELAFFVFPCF